MPSCPISQLLSSSFIFMLVFLCSSIGYSKGVDIQIVAIWEGRELSEPNLDAVSKMRLANPGVPITHLMSPLYFVSSTQGNQNWQAMQKVIGGDDEIGLYLTGHKELLIGLPVIPKYQPTFWGDRDEGEHCEDDCGFDVPVALYDREDTLRLFAHSHQILAGAGFQHLNSFAVRGGVEPGEMGMIAGAFGYHFDLTPIVPSLINHRFQRYPLFGWIQQRWPHLDTASVFWRDNGPVSDLVLAPLNGGIAELTEIAAMTERFDKLLIEAEGQAASVRPVYRITFSQEASFQSALRMQSVLQIIKAKAEARQVEISFSTVSGQKNGRPIHENLAISTSQL